jgi:glycosyltransferase involved in cell wall biosynthesis
VSVSFKPGISVVLVAHNEQARLSEWFNRVGWVDEIVVIDSGSIDRTAEIARKYTEHVFTVSNKLNFDINKNLGFSKASNEWILSLDADEYPSEELIAEILSIVRDASCPYSGFLIPRRNFVLGYEVHIFDKPMRLFRNGNARFAGQTVHQPIQCQGQVGELKNWILHYSDRSLFERIEKTNIYSECMAAYWYEQRKSFHVSRMMWEPVVTFFKYLFQGGYKEGILGFIIAVNGAYSVFLRHAKLWTAYKSGQFPSPSDDYPIDTAHTDD